MKYQDAYISTVQAIRRDRISASRVLLTPRGFLRWYERLVCFLSGMMVIEYD
ncbi:MAG: hypothetical protein GY774_40010 [Planctomycetes bacterium]|nr:hypothetical protein [Planctomycetota bacterium]